MRCTELGRIEREKADQKKEEEKAKLEKKLEKACPGLVPQDACSLGARTGEVLRRHALLAYPALVLSSSCSFHLKVVGSKSRPFL